MAGTIKFAILLIALNLLLRIPLPAHHSFAVEFDVKQRVTLKGVVTKVEWTNPHTYFYVDVRGESGAVVNWAFETAGPNTLARQGWSRQSLKIGDQVTVTGYRARDGSPIASAREVVLSDGRKVFVGSTIDGGPQR
jgi:Family of unknown function (DUF6152)